MIHKKKYDDGDDDDDDDEDDDDENDDGDDDIFPQFHSFFVPKEGLPKGLAPERQSESKDMLFYTPNKSHKEDFTHRSL